ncbi:MAG: HAMP domain-containing protein [Treponema sp.]|nr:HAMP domain-containing protein [Treponema sp.]
MRINLHSLQFRLIAMVLAIVVVSNVALTVIADNLSSATVTETVHQLMDAVTDSAASKIQGEIEKHVRLVETVSAIDFVRDPAVPLAEKCVRLRALSKISDDYENVAFYDTDGNSITAGGMPIHFPDRLYIKEALKGNLFQMEPMVSSATGEFLQQYSAPVRDFNNKIIGVAVVNLYGESLSRKLADIHFGKQSDIFVISRTSGKTVASKDVQRVYSDDNAFEADDAGIRPIMEGLKTGASGGGAFYDSATGVHMTSAYRPIEGTSWSVLCVTAYNDFYATLQSMLRLMVVLLAIILVIALFASGTTVALSLKPLMLVKGAITEIASGDADLTRRIKTKAKDEVGDVVNGFNAFTGKLYEIITQIKQSKDTLGSVGMDLENSTQETSASITQILSNIEGVHGEVTRQGQSVHGTAGAVNQITANIESLESMIEKQASGVAEASAAVEEMIGNIRSVNQSMEKMSGSFEELSNSAKNGSSLQTDVNEKISQIQALSETLQEANTAIASIASQTNLLAMNAAIEAAHAGDAGKGFSVVADEIRKLSETSSIQSRTIGEQLTNIQQSIASVVTASEQSNQAFETVTAKIAETDQLVRQIKAAMEEQNEGSRQINNVLHSMNDSSLEVRNAGKEMMEGNKAILSEVQNLQDATEVIQTRMEEMTQGARKINETGEMLKGISSQVQASIQEIGGQIDRFTV